MRREEAFEATRRSCSTACTSGKEGMDVGFSLEEDVCVARGHGPMVVRRSIEGLPRMTGKTALAGLRLCLGT